MKMKLLGVALLALVIGHVGSAQAATYTLDYNAAVEMPSATGTFTTGEYEAIESATMDFVISGKEIMTNKNGYSWYYDPHIQLSIGGTEYLARHELFQGFSVLSLNLGTAALNQIIANQSIGFNILALVEFWWSDLSPWGGYSQTRFYLDQVTLNVTPSTVPLPAAMWLFGSGLVGLVGFAKRKKAAV